MCVCNSLSKSLAITLDKSPRDHFRPGFFLEIPLSGSGVPIPRALVLYIVLVFNLGSQGVATNVKKGVMWVM